jgi:hypothetical protein
MKERLLFELKSLARAGEVQVFFAVFFFGIAVYAIGRWG